MLRLKTIKMEKMKKLFTLLLTAGIAVGAYAQEKVSIKQTEANKVAVMVDEAANETLTLKITDASGDVVLRNRIAQGQTFAQSYNLEGMPVGIYTVSLTGQGGILTSARVENTVAMDQEVFSRVSKVDENSYRLVVSSLDAKDVQVKIYDGGELIHTETVDNPQGLHKIFTVNRPSVDGVSFKVETASGFETYVAGE